MTGKLVYGWGMKTTFEEVLEWGGGTHQALAEKLGLKSGQAVTMWGGLIPEAQAYKIQVLSSNRFKVSELPVRPRKRA